jgi:HTH-type transcriptional regulator / antitoxin HigA
VGDVTAGRGEAMTVNDLERVEQAWPDLTSVLFVPHAEDDFGRLVALLDGLVDRVGEDEAHPLASLMEVVGTLIERYEDEPLALLQPIADAPKKLPCWMALSSTHTCAPAVRRSATRRVVKASSLWLWLTKMRGTGVVMALPRKRSHRLAAHAV